MKIISKTLKLLTVFLLVLGVAGCSDDDDGNDQNPNACAADAGTLTADEDSVSLLSGSASISATANGDIVVPANYDVTYVLTSGTNLVIEQAGANPSFNVTESGLYTIHTLVAETSDNTDPNFLDLSVINFGTTTGGDVLDIVTTNNLCASLDVAGAPINVLFTVVELALDSGLSSLAAALTATDLVSVLQGDGPFTVFAPDNDAFATLLADTGLDLDNLSTEEETLVTNILLNHVISGSDISSTDLVSAGAGYELTGAVNADGDNLNIYFNTSNGVVLNGQSTVDNPDNTADNGIVHIVDTVIALPTVVTFATADPNFDNLEASLAEADGSAADPMYIPTLMGDGPFTVFAPDNDAFVALLNSNMAWNSPADIDDDLLNSVLAHHVANGNIRAEDLNDGDMAPTLEGDMITINLPGNDGNPAKITDGAGNTDIDITVVNVQANNGVIHVIESVLIPDTTN
ncbi:fasciclin domain-containing protein [Winogradskyella sp.]|uniref:fasciclin domain-containing protein n=1 Tax=Winogradskyella sp. TaxID=1883156 RepID=UPI002613FF7F|nr:fasciclin domain-containing protein [Winogradskyella sp.]